MMDELTAARNDLLDALEHNEALQKRIVALVNERDFYRKVANEAREGISTLIHNLDALDVA